MSIKFLTEKEAAKVLKVPERTLARLRRDPDTTPPVPHSRLGSNVRYETEALYAWAKTYKKKTKERIAVPPLNQIKKTTDQFFRLR